MSIVKIQSVKRLDQAIQYIQQETKTRNDLISTFGCDRDFILEDFNYLYEKRKNLLRKETKNKAKMIIQSFDFEENITPEEVHKIGIEFADNYLKGEHQYIIATHIDTNYIHNHIIFNQVKMDSLLLFDTSRRNTIDNLRHENDQLSKKYHLIIPQEKKHEDKLHYITQREQRARLKGTSFKEKLEVAIDQAIENSHSYDQFIEEMDQAGFKPKQGKYLAFLNDKTNRYMRTKTLGMNYTENSIRYRIEHKNFQIYKFDYTLKTKAIDKTEAKYANNYGLRKWATKQNILHLQEISHLVFNEHKSLEEIEEIQKTEAEFTQLIENNLQEKDEILHDLVRKERAFSDYQASAGLIANYKAATNKQEFKNNHYQEFKKFDNAKKDLNHLKKQYGIYTFEDLQEYKESILKDRSMLYKHFTEMQKQKYLEKKNERKR